MAAPSELRQYPGTPQDSEAHFPTQIGILSGRRYQRLFCGSGISCCFEKVKRCASYLYGPPFPPLSPNQVDHHYGLASACVLAGTMFGGCGLYLMVEAATNPSPTAQISPEAGIVFLSGLETICLSLVGGGLLIIHKTCKAPRLGDRQALL
jgi:hypothetical protein